MRLHLRITLHHSHTRLPLCNRDILNFVHIYDTALFTYDSSARFICVYIDAGLLLHFHYALLKSPSSLTQHHTVHPKNTHNSFKLSLSHVHHFNTSISPLLYVYHTSNSFLHIHHSNTFFACPPLLLPPQLLPTLTHPF